MARKTGIMGTAYDTEARPKKTRQGRGKHSKYSATSRNSARKRYRGQGRWTRFKEQQVEFGLDILLLLLWLHLELLSVLD